MTATSERSGDTAAKARAIGLMCAGLLSLSVNDAIAKWLMVDYEPLQIVFVRQMLALPMILAVLLATAGPAGLRTASLRVHALRGLFLVGGACCFFLGIRHLPLAEATSLIFAAPIFITALSVPVLGEKVGWRRWSAVLVGFIGVLIVVRPGLDAFQPGALYVIAAAFLYALIMLSVRWVHEGERFWTMVFYFMLFTGVFSGLLVVLVWRPLQLEDIPIFLAMAVAGTLGITLMSQAFRFAPAAIVAPFDYTALIWATLWGWMFWNEFPDAWTYAGAAVIAASGIYIVLRETRLGKAR